MFSLTRLTTSAALAGGLLWSSKAAIIAARDDSFNPMESVFFIGGLAAWLTATVGLAILAARRFGGVRGAAAGIGTVVCTFAVVLAVESLGKSAISGAASGSNLGLEQEGGIFAVGLVWLVASAVLAARAGTPGRTPATA